MKPDDNSFATSSEAGEKLLSKFLSVDELLIRPTADGVSDAAAWEGDAPKKVARISLERFQELEQCIRNFPADSEPYEELAKIYIQQERWKDARRVLDLGVAHNPNHEPMLVLREEVMLQASAQELELAKKQARQNRSEESTQHRQRCEIDLANLRLSVCEARLARHPEQLELHIPCAIALRQLGRMSEAVERLKRAQKEPHLRARASLQLGMCLQQLDDVLGALAAYRKAALYRSPPPSTDLKRRALELAAEIAEQNHLVHAAIQYIKILLETDPPHRDAWNARLEKLQALPL